MGFLKIQDTSLISYRLSLELTGINVEGYSVTNIGGPHETKSYIKGTYDSDENLLKFREYGIEYTKSDVDTYDFCFVHFQGKVKRLQKQDVIEGNFYGKYEDGVSCIDGELMVKSIYEIYKKAEKTDRKIQRLKIVPDSVKSKVDVTKTIDEKRLNMLKANENTSIFSDSEFIELRIWDAGKIDGDRITLSFNGETLLKNHQVVQDHKIIRLELKNAINRISVLAENVGSVEPNTAKIELIDDSKTIEMLSNLKAKEKTTLILHRLKK